MSCNFVWGPVILPEMYKIDFDFWLLLVLLFSVNWLSNQSVAPLLFYCRRSALLQFCFCCPLGPVSLKNDI